MYTYGLPFLPSCLLDAVTGFSPVTFSISTDTSCPLTTTFLQNNAEQPFPRWHPPHHPILCGGKGISASWARSRYSASWLTQQYLFCRSLSILPFRQEGAGVPLLRRHPSTVD